MLKKNIIMAILVTLIVVIIIYFLTKKRFKILPTSSPSLLAVQYGKEFGLIEITPTQQITLESNGIRFVGTNRKNTVGVYSLGSGKKILVNYITKRIINE